MDPLTGRWPSKDPIGEGSGANMYFFLGNDGVNGIDILGLMTEIEAYVAGADDAINKTKNSMDQEKGPESRREFCGLICKCKGQYKPTQAHPGSKPALKAIYNSNTGHVEWIRQNAGSCDPTYNSDTNEPVTCASSLGNDWTAAGAYHSHPFNSGFSDADKPIVESGYPYALVTPNGKIIIAYPGHFDTPTIIRPARSLLRTP